jgi:glycosyltransferase involved in cell wall biosynthesis
MKIAIAAWHLAQFNVGIGRYSRALVEAISRVDEANDYLVLTPKSVPLSLKTDYVKCRVRRLPVFRRRGWEQIIPLLNGPYDLLHLPYDSCVAWKRGKFVVTIHDIKPLLFPALRSKRSLAGMIEQWLVGDRAKKVDHVITVSESSKRDIVHHLGLSPDKIMVVYPGVDSGWFARPSAFRSEGKPYVLSVAGADPTKNVEAVVKAYAGLPPDVRNAFDLLLAGDVKKLPAVNNLVETMQLNRAVRFAGVVSDDELRRLYWGATLFVFPSLYEGFGFPVVEAMAAGCPVISSNTSSLPEVGGDAALFIDPHDVKALTDTVQRVLTSSELQQKMIRMGLDQAGKFLWDKTANETIAVYKKVIGQL